MRQSTRVSIGLPVYNGERFLSSALESILHQTFRNLEVIISDNASTDATQAICEEYASRDLRVRYHRHERNLGAPANFNRAFQLATSPFFKWMAYDDMLEPEFVQRCFDALARDDSAVLAFSRVVGIDDDGRRTRELPLRVVAMDDPRAHRRFREIACVRHDAFQLYGLMRRQALADTMLHGHFAAGDKVLLAELALRGRFIDVPEPLFLLRQHAERGSATSIYLRSRWHDPDANMRFFFPHWRILSGYVRAARRAPISMVERRNCYRALARLVLVNWNWARLMTDLLVAAIPSSWRLFERGRRWMRSRQVRVDKV